MKYEGVDVIYVSGVINYALDKRESKGKQRKTSEM